MENNILLSICIPTYNRPNCIKDLLKEILPIVQVYKVLIYISDNSDNSETQEVVESFNSEFIKYNRNTHNLVNRNFLKVIQLPISKYRWLLSDSNYFQEDLLKTILEKCEQNTFDYIFLNSGRVNEIVNNTVYEDPNQLLSDLGWHLTHISSIIYSERILINTSYIDRYLDTNYIHHALVFEPFADSRKKAIWINEPIYYAIGIVKKNTWLNMAFEVWAKSWPEYVLSLPPAYDLSTKLSCIRDHDKYTHLFSPINLIRRKKDGLLIREDYKKNKEFVQLITKTPKWVINLALYMPQSFLLIINSIYHAIKRLFLISSH